ncbi:hypothetical protein N0V92_002639 [Colletotrichum tropicale]|nr:hypothetical protein N0V92_002639 [Colletotrichum tropicale]
MSSAAPGKSSADEAFSGEDESPTGYRITFNGAGGSPDEDAEGETDDEDLLPNNPKGDHSSCNLPSFKKDGKNYAKNAARPCKHDPRNQCFCSSHRGCKPSSNFTDTSGVVSNKTCLKCRMRSMNRRKKTPEERAKAKALAKVGKTARISAKKTTKSTISGCVMKTPTKNTPVKKSRSTKKKSEKSELFVSSESESDSEDEEMTDDHPKGPVHRRTPDDEDDAPGQDGSMGGGLTGSILVA